MQRGAWASGVLAAGAGTLAYAVRGRSSQLFGPSFWRGPRNGNAVALTFDDGPSESTPRILEALEHYGVPATFFQCGANIRRLPSIARAVVAAGHEIGNHSETHAALYLRPAHAIYTEFAAAQRTIVDHLGLRPRWLRPPFGARWFGFRAMQKRLELTGVMWTVIGRDWTLSGPDIARRIIESVRGGSILCLHDGRELTSQPDVRATVDAVRRIVPELLARGWRFQTVSDLLCPAR